MGALLVLNEEPASLVFDVLPVRIRQEIIPDPAFARQSPQPELLTGHLLISRPVSEAVIVGLVVAPEEVIELPHHVIRLIPLESIVVVGCEVTSE